jgi:carbonic anhydrase/acetyltransferase-like protein (isoleucine patch superfamily)
MAYTLVGRSPSTPLRVIGRSPVGPDMVPWMAIYALGDRVPVIHPSAFIHPDCTIIGSVEIGADSSVWPSAVIRGDGLTIKIGERTSIQDGAVLHTTDFLGTTVGNDCVIGHLVHLEGCTIEDGSLVGNASIVLHRVVVQTGSIVAANAVVLNDVVVPSGAIAMGVPAKIREGAADTRFIQISADSYVERSRMYKTDMRRID